MTWRITLTHHWRLRYDREDRDVTNLVPTEPRSIYVDFVPDGVQVGGAPLNPGAGSKH